ncbi:anti-phage dCTP deaminase [Ralstonia pseudosolanacearum]|uniref:anti-phage dCTP deaminase n=1 Tax=Ralstonia pseudosolanacearum TaxID=1310165 RepID=UPI00267450C9|nr:anti-phage dCTP deaminase [Ralstonia pseudosolanacearum]MDO3522780.1 anti-phage dCTP deaminase [Ralstonia pseudosolanacearum]MDO3533496.1 anti-phage dCTP deaminase [Ralstonia pseudosolanacearum]MDO3549154.1 anti-phage dCTP deaminase [Ralstonia pseudosolanacearum]MDO3554464.1 anti-phage dCTP deaminase [Ralstonia pseudosolanacearum]MDO3568962.1 anti-phage dCTP deaminase [Ralstonia pseudosolanacearum]
MPKMNLIGSAPKKAPHNTSAFDDQSAIDKSRTPEIVIALCGPMGTPLHEVAQTFEKLLKGTDYNYEQVSIIRLSNEIRDLAKLTDANCSTKELIEAGNKLRQEHGYAYLARVAIKKITLAREALNVDRNNQNQASLFDSEDSDEDLKPIYSIPSCHIIDSIKNIEELKLLRSVYGDMLHVVGVYTPIDMRIEKLSKRANKGDHVQLLIDRDSGEEIDYGQQVGDTFPQSDFFLRADAGTDSQLHSRVKRFLDLMLGTRIATPTPNERAMYAAYSAARNSACLSRQVGASLTSETGEILSVGWNDVPKAFGGLYEARDGSDSVDGDHRCWNIEGGHCFNDEEKDLIADAVVNRMVEKGIVEQAKRDNAFEVIRRDSQLRGLIEFSRAVHAEMHALLNAGATHGSQVRGGKLFVTTYPCHSCARHIVAAGIEEVYFLEPYRKSLATKLHADSITEREGDGTKVRILPFDGVAPSRFLKFFSTHDGGRKDSTGKMRMRAAFPVTAITLEAIPRLEALAVRSLQFGQPQATQPAGDAGAGAGVGPDDDK